MLISRDAGPTWWSETNRPWWMLPTLSAKPIEFQKIKDDSAPQTWSRQWGVGWGEARLCREYGCQVSTDLVEKCACWHPVTSFGHLVILLNWADCRFGSNQAPVTQRTLNVAGWTFVSSSPRYHSDSLSRHILDWDSLKLGKYRLAS